jgi:metal-responsive CopG/Arc/MetJ family transcriptional regulator
MDVTAIRFPKEVLKNIDKAIAHYNFSSRTEFIREAVRDKLNEINKKEAATDLNKKENIENEGRNRIKHYSM